MKKIIAVFLAFATVFCFAGCGKKNVKLKVIEENLGAEEYGIAFREGDDETCKIVEAAVCELVKNGTYKKIAEKEEYKEIIDNLIFLNDDYKNSEKTETVDLKKVEKRTFTMGIDAEYPPFSFRDKNGNYTGFDVEICKAVCDMLGWEMKIFPVNWDSKLIQLSAKECDCVWSGMTILDEMKEKGYVISKPYYYNSQVIVTREDSNIKSSKDLKGKYVAVQKGTSGETLLKEDMKSLSETFKELKSFDTFLICFTELESGSVDAVVVDIPVGKSYVSKQNKK